MRADVINSCASGRIARLASRTIPSIRDFFGTARLLVAQEQEQEQRVC